MVLSRPACAARGRAAVFISSRRPLPFFFNSIFRKVFIIYGDRYCEVFQSRERLGIHPAKRRHRRSRGRRFLWSERSRRLRCLGRRPGRIRSKGHASRSARHERVAVMKIYCASKAKHAPWWRALRAAGVPIICTWPDWARNIDGVEPTSDEWSRHWQRCTDEASAADVCLFLDLPGENQCGALVELGCALAMSRRVYLVSENWWSIQNHPSVRKFRALEDAVSAIMAACAGEASRLSQLSTPTDTPQAPATIHKLKP